MRALIAATAAIYFASQAGLCCADERRDALLAQEAIVEELSRLSEAQDPFGLQIHSVTATSDKVPIHVRGIPVARLTYSPSADGQKIPFFETDDDQLNQGARRAIGELAGRIIKSSTKIKSVLVVGHADARSYDSHNYKLSLRRAQNVARELLAHGVEREAVAVLGLAARLPAASNASPEGMAKNRRVEFYISSLKDGPQHIIPQTKYNVCDLQITHQPGKTCPEPTATKSPVFRFPPSGDQTVETNENVTIASPVTAPATEIVVQRRVLSDEPEPRRTMQP